MKIKFKAISGLLFCLLFSFYSYSQNDTEQDNWLGRKGGKLFYGLEGYSFTSFLKTANGVMAYSQEKGKVFYLNEEHVIQKEWEVKTHHDILENPQFYFYNDHTVILGSFLNKTALWFDLENMKMRKEREQKNPKSKFLEIDHFSNLKFGKYRLVLNQNTNHPEILASLYAFKDIRRKALYTLSIPNAGVAQTGNVIDFVAYQNQLWVLDVVNKKILIFNKELELVLEKDIKYLWDFKYLKKIPRTGQMIPIDCQLYYDNINQALYLSKQSYSKEGGIKRNSSIYRATLSNGDLKLDKILERDSYLNINQITARKMYILEPGQEKESKDRSFSIMDQGKYQYVYEIEL